MSSLGRLGQFGNQIFQYSFLRVYAELHGLRVACPDWLGRHAFALYDDLLPPSAAALPLVPDRVVLSHAGWRRWAATREPLAGLIRANGGKQLSGKALRRLVPQVCGDSLAGSQACEQDVTSGGQSSARHDPSGGSCDLCGWFQFHTTTWRPHAPRLQQLFRPHARLSAALEAALCRLLRSDGAGREKRPLLLAIHLRSGDAGAACGGAKRMRRDAGAGAEAGAGAGAARAGASAGAEGAVLETTLATTGESPLDAATGWVSPEWEDRSTFWAAPPGWYERWANDRVDRWVDETAEVARRGGEATSSPRDGPGCGAPSTPSSVAVLVCGDSARPTGALASSLPPACRAVAWADLHGTAEWGAVEDAWAASFPEAAPPGASSDCDDSRGRTLRLFADWWALGQADALAISNSTFSFTAAMLACPPRTPVEPNRPDAAAEPAVAHRFWRPDPEAGALVPFDPWDAKPLLTCSEAAAARHGLVGYT